MKSNVSTKNPASATGTFAAIFPEFAPYPDLILQLCTLLKRHILRPGQLLVTAGDQNDRFYFIASGMVRGVYHNDTDDSTITSWFETEGGYVAIPHSYFKNEPSLESIEALETGIAFSVSRADLQHLQVTNPAMGMVGRAILVRYMVQMEHQLRALRMTTAKQRVDYFRVHFPTIYKRAPLRHIASFLSMTPQTLSKIRNIRE
ncbi:Crp/Fnr family transcriptional regulator [Fibrella forsythiae]|uniref:Crp/Fnr family transcriptional regulator n=1 Tax=Fibrella forsythiae TaxID=2817061 RepID=A0ABS3JGV0_9BACT|nr:Crp/Fnr family transcriptional regulator [Fibrella forsythiae]MBO0948628.1 Crp/Fnr family transcriptional regulator [Fibrella forsythiae]